MPTVEDLAQRIDTLEARLRAAEDVQAIHRLKARYAQLVDARYERRGGVVERDRLEAAAQAIAELFTPDGVWDGGAGLGVCKGREEIFRRMCEPTLSFSWHFFLKPLIEVEGDRAHGSWDILSPCTSTEGRAMWMAGVEDDRYVRMNGVWLHEHMKLDLVFLAPHDKGWAKRRE
jgi:SnoaL-like protein